MRHFLALLCCNLFLSGAVSVAEPLPVEVLEKQASHIVTGKVKHVFVSEERFAAPKNPQFGFDEQNRYIVEVTVESIEKGEGMAEKQTIFARLMTKRYGVGATDRKLVTEGHSSIPKMWEKGRFYLSKSPDAFFYTVIGPNGYKLLPKPKIDYSGANETDPPSAAAPPILD